MQNGPFWIEEDILLVDKPKGPSSFDMIRILRKELGIKKMGHAGTLDPLASGLLIIGIGSGTKKMTSYLGLSKTYKAVIVLGQKSKTGDAEGEISDEKDASNVDSSNIQKVVAGFTGIFNLPVPIYSAIKKDGLPLYKRARNGEDVDLPIKRMEIKTSKFLGLEISGKLCLVQIEWEVSSGSYIRSLAEEFGRRLGYPARLEDLRRTKINGYHVEDAYLVNV